MDFVLVYYNNNNIFIRMYLGLSKNRVYKNNKNNNKKIISIQVREIIKIQKLE